MIARNAFRLLCICFFPFCFWGLGWDVGFDGINFRPLLFYLLYKAVGSNNK